MKLTISLLLISLALSNSQLILESPKVTDWGDWFAWEYCPSGMYATGMRLKTEPGQGMFGDDHSNTGIRFYCNYPGQSNTHSYIESKTESPGGFGNNYLCGGGSPITGFQLRSEENQGPLDDSAGNNLRVFCNWQLSSFIEGDGNDFGYWTNARHCGTRQAFCGISTQVEEAGHTDETALNNFKVECCTVPNPATTCTPTDEWKRILICDNSEGTQPKVCKYEKRIGVGYTHKPDPEYPHAKEFYTSSGFTLEEEVPLLQSNIQKSLTGKKSHNTVDWAGVKGQGVWVKEDATLGTIEVPPHSSLSMYQAIAHCGIFSSHSNRLKTVVTNSLTKSDSISYMEI